MKLVGIIMGVIDCRVKPDNDKKIASNDGGGGGAGK